MEAVGANDAGRRVLIADDDAVTRTLLAQCFKNEGFAVATTADGMEACSMALVGKLDVVLLDLLLPRRDGYSVLLYLRSQEATRQTPVLILSAETSEEHPGIARALGAQGYVTKPFSPTGVVATVNDILSKNGKGWKA